MTPGDDRISIWINKDDAPLRGAQRLRPVLERLARSFLSPPTKVEPIGKKEHTINGFLDQAIAKVLDQRQRGLRLYNSAGLHVEFLQLGPGTVVTVLFPVGPPAEQVRELFIDLVRIIAPTYARCHLDHHSRALHDAHYSDRRRTFYASGLFWLNFFGPDELARQGGAALMQNPYARTERLDSGLLVQVGDDPLAAATPVGERQLVAATDAMPSVGDATPAPQSLLGETSTKNEERDDAAAELTTVNGVRGFLDHRDNAFWVSKHLAPGRVMDRETIARLRSVPGSGQPPVSAVNVLFSLREAAERNRAALAAAGIRAWYVDLETGTPREV